MPEQNRNGISWLAKRNPLGRDPRLPQATATLKELIRTALSLDGEATVSVSEMACSRQDCPPRETIILIFPPAGPAIRLSIHKAIIDIGPQDITNACKNGADTTEADATTASPAHRD